MSKIKNKGTVAYAEMRGIDLTKMGYRPGHEVEDWLNETHPNDPKVFEDHLAFLQSIIPKPAPELDDPMYANVLGNLELNPAEHYWLFEFGHDINRLFHHLSSLVFLRRDKKALRRVGIWILTEVKSINEQYIKAHDINYVLKLKNDGPSETVPEVEKRLRGEIEASIKQFGPIGIAAYYLGMAWFNIQPIWSPIPVWTLIPPVMYEDIEPFALKELQHLKEYPGCGDIDPDLLLHVLRINQNTDSDDLLAFLDHKNLDRLRETKRQKEVEGQKKKEGQKKLEGQKEAEGQKKVEGDKKVEGQDKEVFKESVAIVGDEEEHEEHDEQEEQDHPFVVAEEDDRTFVSLVFDKSDAIPSSPVTPGLLGIFSSRADSIKLSAGHISSTDQPHIIHIASLDPNQHDALIAWLVSLIPNHFSQCLRGIILDSRFSQQHAESLAKVAGCVVHLHFANDSTFVERLYDALPGDKNLLKAYKAASGWETTAGQSGKPQATVYPRLAPPSSQSNP